MSSRCMILQIYSSQNGWTALIGAARNGHTEVVKFLVKETNAEVNAKTNVSVVVAMTIIVLIKYKSQCYTCTFGPL